MAAKKSRKKRARTGAKGQTKAAFIRDRAGKTAAEIQAEAQAAGLKMSIAQIYSQRSQDKRKGGAPTKRGGKKRGRRAVNGAAGAEQQLRVAVAKLGLDRARSVLDEVESAFLGR